MTQSLNDSISQSLNDSMSQSDRIVLAGVHAHINQGKAGSRAVGLNGDKVLVPLGSNLQLHRVSAAVVPARDGLGAFLLTG